MTIIRDIIVIVGGGDALSRIVSGQGQNKGEKEDVEK